jgi:hypothetical protein
MTSAILRKARHLLDDPVLRRWLLRRIAGLEKSPRKFSTGAPPYLGQPNASNAEQRSPRWTGRASAQRFRPIDGTVKIDLPGLSVDVSSDNPGALFDRDYPDLETLLAAHRFAWVPLAGPGVDAGWVNAIWEAWIARYNTNRNGWPWHAYTAAERAINIIDFADRFGLPGNREDSVQSLAGHAETIRNNLEYFGEHYTSNHLSNNGRGLLRIGVALGIEEYAEDGAKILIAEAGRIFGRSGLLNEGSSHYHLLVTRNYIDAWLAADKAGIEHAPILEDIAEQAVAAVSGLCLPGGMPLIGDISPDAPPAYFALLTGAETDDRRWPSMMNEEYRIAVTNLVSRVTPVSPDRLSEDGWHRFGKDDWLALAFVPPDGWPPMPGHGHQDLGSFELHDGISEVIVDPGRGSYADPEYASAGVHSGVMIDGQEPAPVNRPYYDDAFRRRVVPQMPEFERTRTGRVLRSFGFARVRGIEKFERQWRFKGGAVEILDTIQGSGKRRIDRRYVTSTDVEISDGFALLSANGRRWRLRTEIAPTVKPATRWMAYGEGRPGSVITFGQTEKLPFEGKTVLERL